MVVVMLVGMLVSMAGKFADSRGIVFLGGFIVVMSAILGVAGTYYYGVYKRRPRRKKTIRTDTRKAELPPAVDTTNKLPPIPAAAEFSSVTEETTTRLKVR
jgi:hypothetical protein